MMATLRVPVTMASNNNNFQKRIQKDSKKVSKAFDKLSKESEVRREDLSKNLKSWVDELDKLAKKDVKRIQEIFEDSDIEVSIDINEDDFDTVDDVVVFKRNDVY
jgi:predicted outer membrane protein